MPSPRKTAAIILAAGRGQRMGESVDGPKQYLPLDSKTSVLGKTLSVFLDSDRVDMVQVVIHPDDVTLYKSAISPHRKLLPPAFGGATRQESALNGLAALEGLSPDIALIHDAARPFPSNELVGRVIDGLTDGYCTLPAMPVSDTLKQTVDTQRGPVVTATLPRDGLFLAQTPQGFFHADILAAHRKAEQEGKNGFTDDCAVAEWAGNNILIVAGEAENFKITTLNDLKKAKEYIRMDADFEVPDIRTGIGYDVHRLVPGDGVILCGVRLDSDRKLDGHSDADVALHALTDALLGTIADGDIGNHFPPSDPVWSGAASDQFLAHACTLVREKKGVITHLDVTIICEEPKIGPHRDAMRKSVAGICGIDPERVSVKATTHERIGTIGRGEGIAAMATASVVITS